MQKQSTVSRRQFLKGLGAAAAAPYVWAPSAMAAASDRIVFGCIGMGTMGMGDMRGFLYMNDVQIAAVCDVDAARRDRAKRTVEAHYSKRAAKGSYKGCDAYNDFREIIARDDIDAVLIATPDHWHILPAVMAAKSGKDMYVEKPLSLTVEQGRVLADTLKRYGRVCQAGSQQRSSWNFRYACELVRNGRIGELKTIRTGLAKGRRTGNPPAQPVPNGFDYDLWLGPAPWEPYTQARCHYNFRFIRDYSGGQVTNWGAHHNDIAQWGNGTERTGPVESEGKGDFPSDGLYNVAVTFEFTCTYANGVKLICSTHGSGVRFEGTEGWVYVNRGRLDANPKSLLTSVIGPNEIHLYESRNHKRNLIDCIRSRREPIACAEIAHRSATVCHLGNIAMLLGRKIKWDPSRERIVGDEEASRMLARPMRAPWRL